MEHQAELTIYGVQSETDVANYVASILQSKAKIHYEQGKRLTITVSSSQGIVIVEEKTNQTGDIEYSIVTAYPKRGNPHGSIVGNLK